MRKITLWLMSTVAALVLLFSYRTSTGGDGASAATSSSSTSSSSTSSSGASTSGGSGTYTGSAASTRWGTVQVTITVTNGRITSVSVPVYPSGNGRDAEINAYALPILKQETLAAQSATIDSVSGATVTSGGYKESLQAALDAAHLS